jgi:DNA-binding winged helix-turn-helix (wHTH) protein/Flp pilus assembly protein TadD
MGAPNRARGKRIAAMLSVPPSRRRRFNERSAGSQRDPNVAVRAGRPNYRFGEFTLEPRLQRLTRDDRIVALKPKAYDLLCLLIINRDRVVGKNELIDWLWPRQDVQEANLSQTIYEVRRALEDTGRSSRWIENVPRRGYRFAGTVTEFDRSTSRVPRSIAVLPFRTLSVDPADVHLRLGFADSVSLSLGATGGVAVRPLSAMLRYLDSELDALEIGRQLEVDAVLEGTVQRLGDRLRVNARLLQLPDGVDVWAGRNEGSIGELFAIQDRIAAQVAEAVALRRSAAETRRATRSRPENPEVYALYLKGRYCWHRWTPDASRQAVEYFQRAIALDAGHAPSHAWLSAAWSTLGLFGVLSPGDASARARSAAQQAIALDETCSEGHEMQGAWELFFDWDLAGAARSLDRAIELDPDSSNARHLRALVIALGGDNEPALVEMMRALQADPSSLIAQTDVGMVHYWGRRYDEARRWLEAALVLEPHFTHARFGLAYSLLELGMRDRAVSEMRRLRQSSSGSNIAGHLAYVLGRAGRTSEAAAIVADLERCFGQEPFDPYQIALGYLGLGETDSVFDWLRRALEHRSRDIVLLGVSPIVDPIRRDTRFAALLREAGLARD